MKFNHHRQTSWNANDAGGADLRRSLIRVDPPDRRHPRAIFLDLMPLGWSWDYEQKRFLQSSRTSQGPIYPFGFGMSLAAFQNSEERSLTMSRRPA
jgi:hypothetical protein